MFAPTGTSTGQTGVTGAHIGRVGMDGTHKSLIISTKIMWPNGLTIDYTNDSLNKQRCPPVTLSTYIEKNKVNDNSSFQAPGFVLPGHYS